MTREQLYRTYLNEVSSYEKYGGISVISFEEWLDIKGIQINESDDIRWLKSIKDNVIDKPDKQELNLYKNLLGRTSQDIDILE